MSLTLGTVKNSVMGVKVESTEGTPVLPASGTDYIALQPGFSFKPSYESLANDEIRASIAPSKPIPGIESVDVSFAHYWKHSGTEGTAPEFNDFLKAALGGAETVNSTQRLTTTSSTVSLLKLASGGTDFARGMAVLVKDGTNGYSIRPVKSVSTNDLTLGFNLANAPASGIGVGKCVNYAPANSGHQSLTATLYRGNGHTREVASGCKVTGANISIDAGQLIKTDFTLKGLFYYFNPIEITSTDTKLDFDDGSARVATVAAKLWKDPHELAQALQDSMNAAGSSDTFTVVYNNTSGKFTISTGGSTLSLKWNTGTNTANTIGDKIGFVIAADSTGALTYTSDNAQSFISPYTPSYDTSDPLVAKDNSCLLGSATDNICFEAQSIKVALSNTDEQVKSVCSTSGVSSNLISGRQVKITVTALLNKYDVGAYKNFRLNSSVDFMYAFGNKSGGNWVAGQSGCIYAPSAVISSYEPTDLGSVIGITLELTCFADASGNGEFYLNFL